jgi:hypothetical protein
MANVPVISDVAHTPRVLPGAAHRYWHRSEGTVLSLHASSSSSSGTGSGGALGAVAGKVLVSCRHHPAESEATQSDGT